MPELKDYLLGLLVILGLVGLYILFYLLNKKTPKPEGCENLEEDCEGCQITSCLNRKEKKVEEDS